MNHKISRRNFINLGIPATGAVLLTPGLASAHLIQEIEGQFRGVTEISDYDVVINGAGLAGYFSAIAAAEKGLKVLIVEKRSFAGYEITAKRKLWLDKEGYKSWSQNLNTLFFPEGEKAETVKKAEIDISNDQYEGHYLLLAGSVKKGMLRNLLLHKIHILLMTDVCGIISDNKSVQGVLLATKQGLYSVLCNNFIDTSDNLLFSRQLSNQKFKFTQAGFVLELLKVKNTSNRHLTIPAETGVSKNQVEIFPGKNADHQAFLDFKFQTDGTQVEDIESKARFIAANIGTMLPDLDEGLKEAIVHNYALECSYYIEDIPLPETGLKNYHILLGESVKLSCRSISEVEVQAKQLVNNLSAQKSNGNVNNIVIAGGSIPVSMIKFEDPAEPGLDIPIRKCTISDSSLIPAGKTTEVLIAGGGTAGAAAAIGAMEKGAQALVTDYFNDLGGTKTMGGVMGYYLGITDNKYIKNLETSSSKLSSTIRCNGNIGRRIYLLEQLLNLGGEFLTGSIICGTVTEGTCVTGITVCRDGKLFNILADITIDATGDGDVAHFAGAESEHGNSRTGITQNYSQWNIRGGGIPPSPVNSDYDIIDNTKISELQRGLFLSHYEAHFYDFYPYLTIRESRRIKGLYELTLIDVLEQTHFKDIIALAYSDFDPHFIGNSEFSRCGFLLPHSNLGTVEIPYRSIVPSKLSGLLLSGKAISQTHNALQFTRMSADVTMLGYVTGQIAAFSVIEKTEPKDFDVSQLQNEWFELGYINEAFRNKPVGNKRYDSTETNRRINGLIQGKEEFLYECCKLPQERVLPVLEQKFDTISADEGKLLVAKALAWFGSTLGNNLIEDELKTLFQQELNTGYPGGYIENYDYIRGRGKNVLEGLFWRINQNIGLLAMSGGNTFFGTIRNILQHTSSGGKMIEWSGDRGSYFNSRIDLRIIPYYNRILNLCFFAERKPHADFIEGFENLLRDKNIKGYITDDYNQTRWNVYGGFLELSIAAALARCGSRKGCELLVSYMDDVHYNFRTFALNELTELTSKNFGYNKKEWNSYLNTLSFPITFRGYTHSIEV